MRNYWETEFPNLTEEEIRDFAVASEEPNLIHQDAKAAQELGLLGVLALNTHIDTLVSRTIASEIPGVRVYEKQIFYRNPLYAGSRPKIICKIIRQKMYLVEVRIEVMNGFENIATGTCRLILPRKKTGLASPLEAMSA